MMELCAEAEKRKIVECSPEEDLLLGQLKSKTIECEELQKFASRLDERFLLHFLRGRKYNLESAFVTLKNYFRIREKNYRDLFKTLCPSEAPALECGMFRVLKNKDNLGRLVTVGDFGLWDTTTVTLNDFCKGLILLIEEVWSDPEVEVNGIVMIFDCRKFNFQHLKQWTPGNLMKCINIFWKNYPIKYKKLFVLTKRGSTLGFAYNVIVPLLPSKISERLKLVPGPSDAVSDIFADIEPYILPRSLGGTLTEEDSWNTSILQKIKAKEEYYANFAEQL